MKNMIKFFGVIALVAVIGFSMAGCKEDETNPTPQTVTYKGTADSKTYVLTINEADGTYELTVGGKKSKGSATKSGSTWTLTPTGGNADDVFTVTVSSSGITDIKGEITFTNGSKEDPPTTITPPAPPTGNDPFAGTWDAPFIAPPPDVQRIIAANRSFSQYAVMNGPPEDPREFIRGTYTVSGNSVTITMVSFNTKVFQDSYDASKAEWVTWANLDSDWKTNFGGSPTYSITITNNSFGNGEMTFTKK
jgi:hypothetical protein